MIWAWAVALLPLGALGLTALNLATWPRGGASSPPMRVSILIPARNEEKTIAACVRAALAEPCAEVVVLDDRSTDGTNEVLAGFTDPRLRVVMGRPLAAGWVGKAHACARLVEEASYDQLLFVDADTVLEPGALGRLAGLHERLMADVVSALPRQVLGSFAERWLMPLLHVTYTSWFPLALVHLSRQPMFLAANGQVLSMSREALARVGGFDAIRAEVVDDMALCRRVKESGMRVVFAEGSDIAACRMYGSGRELWEGFAKNVYEGLGSPLGLVLALSLYAATFLAPWGVLFAAAWRPELLLPGLVAVGATLLQRVMLAVRFGHPPWSVLLHGPAVVALMVLALDSFRRSRAGRIRWKGRDYVARGARGG